MTCYLKPAGIIISDFFLSLYVSTFLTDSKRQFSVVVERIITRRNRDSNRVIHVHNKS